MDLGMRGRSAQAFGLPFYPAIDFYPLYTLPEKVLQQQICKT